jgi:hypothetical protein
MAWPKNKIEIDVVIKQSERGILDMESLRAANISYLITDSSCPTGWNPQELVGISEVKQMEYQDQKGFNRLTLWSLDPP